MIGKLRGFIDQVQEDRCLIDVGGVGYVLFISHKTVNLLNNHQKKQEISLIVETLVKQDSIELYGFISEIEKIWFLELMKVQGVGAKMAQKILSALSIEELVKAIASADVKSFSKISGIGPKLASRITTEMRDAPKKLGIDVGIINDNINIDNFDNNNQNVQDALSALENLGYKKHDSLKIINFIISDNKNITLENLITSALRELSKKKS